MWDYIVTALRLLLALILFTQAGVLALVLGRARALALPERLSLAFGLGMGLIAWQMLAMTLLGVPLALGIILAPWAAAWLIYLTALAWRRQPRGQSGRGWAFSWRLAFAWRLQPLELGLLAVLSVVVLAVIVRATFHPVFEWDGWAIWDLKARAFYWQHGLLPFITDAYYSTSHLDYPVLYPLAGTFVYLVLGRITDGVSVLPAAGYGATLVVVYSALRRYGSRRALALALTLGLAVTPNILFWSQQFYAEAPLLFYWLASSLWLFFYLRQPVGSWLWLSAVLAGFATQTKIEGLMLVAPALGALALRAALAAPGAQRRQAWQAAGLYVAIVGTLYLPWGLYQSFGTNIPTAWGAGAQVAQRLSALPHVLVTLLQWMLQPTYQDLFFLIFPVTLGLIVLNWKKYVRELPWAYLLAVSLMALVPSGLLFLIEPQWLEFDRLGRYLVNFTAAWTLVLALHVVDLFQPGAIGARGQRPQWLPQAQRLAVAALLAALSLGLFAEAWPLPWPQAAFTSRPISLLRQVYAEAVEMAPLSAAERQQLVIEKYSAHPYYGRLLEVALQATPPTEAVALWVPPDNTDDFIFRKASYLLFPRKVVVIHDAAELSPAALTAARVGTVMIYDQARQLGQGSVIYQPAQRFAVVRPVVSAASLSHLPDFVPAPATLAGGMHLVGYQVVGQLLNNEVLLLLGWQTTQPLTQSYTVFVHVLSGGELVTQHDSLPMLGMRPTTTWPVGETILDAHPLLLPRDQRSKLTVCIGVYNSASLVRLDIQQADGYDIGPGQICRVWP